MPPGRLNKNEKSIFKHLNISVFGYIDFLKQGQEIVGPRITEGRKFNVSFLRGWRL